MIPEQRAIFFEGTTHDQLAKAASFNFYRMSKVSDTLEQLINIRPTYKSTVVDESAVMATESEIL